MKVLIAEDDDIARRILESMLRRWNYEVVVAADGNAAWKILQNEDSPRIAILDWIMPGLSGMEICIKARTLPIYKILLTSKSLAEDIATGIENGADDYITKPFSPLDLRARILTGEKLLERQGDDIAKEQGITVSTSGESETGPLITICSYCKNVKDEKSLWQSLEYYIGAVIEGRVTHGICPDCYQRALGEWEAKKHQLSPGNSL